MPSAISGTPEKLNATRACPKAEQSPSINLKESSSRSGRSSPLYVTQSYSAAEDTAAEDLPDLPDLRVFFFFVFCVCCFFFVAAFFFLGPRGLGAAAAAASSSASSDSEVDSAASLLSAAEDTAAEDLPDLPDLRVFFFFVFCVCCFFFVAAFFFLGPRGLGAAAAAASSSASSDSEVDSASFFEEAAEERVTRVREFLRCAIFFFWLRDLFFFDATATGGCVSPGSESNSASTFASDGSPSSILSNFFL